MPERLIVIGGAAGAVAPPRGIIAALPAAVPAPVFVCLHLAEGSTRRLPAILDAAGVLSARHPRHRERLEPGVIFVAPPDRHLVVNDGAVQLSRGPKENRRRPAVDALFNSAARWHGPDVVGVVLSGALDDGAAGAAAIAAQDGTVIVQDPEEAGSAACRRPPPRRSVGRASRPWPASPPCSRSSPSMRRTRRPPNAVELRPPTRCWSGRVRTWMRRPRPPGPRPRVRRSRSAVLTATAACSTPRAPMACRTTCATWGTPGHRSR